MSLDSNSQVAEHEKPAKAGKVICVDLDGTLLDGDTLWESVALAVRHKPLILFFLPLWILRGRAYAKAKLADHILPDFSSLAYRQPLIDYLLSRRKEGCEL